MKLVEKLRVLGLHILLGLLLLVTASPAFSTPHSYQSTQSKDECADVFGAAWFSFK